jgi:hypothetical protein
MDNEKIIIVDDIFTKEELDFILSLRNNFEYFESPNRNNYYHREEVKDYLKLSLFLEKSKEYFTILGDDKNTQLNIIGFWVNHIDSNESQRDDYHIDDSEFTSITFLDDDFQGGELEISKYGNKKVIQPKVGRTVFFRGVEFPHRVLPLISGKRHTLVTFWDKKSKKENSLF